MIGERAPAMPGGRTQQGTRESHGSSGGARGWWSALLPYLALTACGDSTPTDSVDPLYQMVCVDSTVSHPLYRCDLMAPDTVEVVIIVTIPNPVP